jgi:hypothetical protein
MTVSNSTRRPVSALGVLLLAGLLSLGLAHAAPAGAAARLALTFEKAAVGAGAWEGTVSGDVNGDLTTRLTGCTGPDPCSGRIWHVEFDWIISAGAESFTARLSGVLDTQTGQVVMNGTVVDGFMQGAQVHEEGQLVDAATLRFEGSITVLPSSA